MAEDYYKTLGVSRNASQAEIQQAYRELARKFHPDLNPDDKNAKSKFQKIQGAFDVLNDAEKREMYDRYGSSFETRGAGGGPSPWGGGGFNAEDVDFSQFFGQRFGDAGGGPSGGPFGGFADLFNQFRSSGHTGPASPRGQKRRGADINHELQIPFNTAINGGEVQITVQRQSGKNETISVKVPAGIQDGKKIRVRGQGEPAPRRGAPGDILLTIHVAAHPCFRRKGDNLHVTVPVTLGEAALGAKVDVPTPRGAGSLRVPPGTSSGTKLRIKGQGVVRKGATPGDLLAEIQIVLPKDLDDTDCQLIEQLAKRHSQNPRSELRW